jgi:hypothetical protein
MTARIFFLQTSLITLATIALLFGLSFYPPFSPFFGFGLICLFFFVALSIIMYITGSRAAVSPQQGFFTQLILVFTIVKMFLSIIVVFVYFKVAKPGSSWFLLPFFLVYLIYTIFESYFMIRIGKSTKPTLHE